MKLSLQLWRFFKIIHFEHFIIAQRLWLRNFDYFPRTSECDDAYVFFIAWTKSKSFISWMCFFFKICNKIVSDIEHFVVHSWHCLIGWWVFFLFSYETQNNNEFKLCKRKKKLVVFCKLNTLIIQIFFFFKFYIWK